MDKKESGGLLGIDSATKQSDKVSFRTLSLAEAKEQ